MLQNFDVSQLEAEIAKLGLDAETQAKLLAQAKENLARDQEKLSELKEKIRQRKDVAKRSLSGAEKLNGDERANAETARDEQQEADRLNETQALVEALRANQLVSICLVFQLSIQLMSTIRLLIVSLPSPV